jgi:hypothetical protein
MEALSNSETSINHQSTRCNIPEGSHLKKVVPALIHLAIKTGDENLNQGTIPMWTASRSGRDTRWVGSTAEWRTEKHLPLLRIEPRSSRHYRPADRAKRRAMLSPVDPLSCYTDECIIKTQPNDEFHNSYSSPDTK